MSSPLALTIHVPLSHGLSRPRTIGGEMKTAGEDAGDRAAVSYIGLVHFALWGGTKHNWGKFPQKMSR